MRLSQIPIPDYIATVLPKSKTLWAGSRTYDEYVADLQEIAASPYGAKRFRTVGLHLDGRLVCSFKRYERELHCGEHTLRAFGIGAVFTPPEERGRGYASAMLGAVLDAERAAGIDIAYLFSDIHPVFYERLGFIALPSRVMTLNVDLLDDRRIETQTIGDADWAGVRRCFETLESRRAMGLRRTPLVWDFIRLRSRSREQTGQLVELLVRTSRTVSAYVFGRRIPERDSFVVDEYAYTGDEGFDAIPALLRSGAGDLRKVSGWLPPDIARAAIPRGAVRKRRTAITMIAPLSKSARLAWRAAAPALLADDADRVWSTDHI